MTMKCPNTITTANMAPRATITAAVTKPVPIGDRPVRLKPAIYPATKTAGVIEILHVSSPAIFHTFKKTNNHCADTQA